MYRPLDLEFNSAFVGALAICRVLAVSGNNSTRFGVNLKATSHLRHFAGHLCITARCHPAISCLPTALRALSNELLTRHTGCSQMRVMRPCRLVLSHSFHDPLQRQQLLLTDTLSERSHPGLPCLSTAVRLLINELLAMHTSCSQRGPWPVLALSFHERSTTTTTQLLWADALSECACR